MHALKKLVFGETWLLPAGVAVAVAGAVGLRDVLGSEWHEVGGFVLLTMTAVLAVVSVSRSAAGR